MMYTENDARMQIIIRKSAMTRRGRWLLVITIAVVIVAMHAMSTLLGLYEEGLPVDKPQHFLGGAALGIVWLLIVEKSRSGTVQGGIFALGIVSFAVFGSFLWEVLEFLFSRAVPHLAQASKLYSPTVDDLIGDMLGGFFGGAAVAVWLLWSRCRHRGSRGTNCASDGE
jgi:hypothetical protein